MMNQLENMCRTMVRCSGVAFLTLTCLGTNVYAQTLSGTVADRDTGGPLASVSVQLFDANGRPVAVEVTDSNGFYTMPLGTPGVYAIVARGWGHERAELGPVERCWRERSRMRVGYMSCRRPVRVCMSCG